MCISNSVKLEANTQWLCQVMHSRSIEIRGIPTWKEVRKHGKVDFSNSPGSNRLTRLSSSCWSLILGVQSGNSSCTIPTTSHTRSQEYSLNLRMLGHEIKILPLHFLKFLQSIQIFQFLWYVMDEVADITWRSGVSASFYYFIQDES